jgi:hypothetical protein
LRKIRCSLCYTLHTDCQYHGNKGKQFFFQNKYFLSPDLILDGGWLLATKTTCANYSGQLAQG